MENNKEKISSTQLKSEIIKLMDGMVAFQKAYPKFDFPKVSENFKLTRELIEKGEFNLAVCGKVKNGKSSLINALIGRELLPVCTDVATSRVFKISHSNEEKFYVVYGNGDRKEISQDELATYGSQVVINKKGEADIEKTISYIQVFTPMDFLPEGVSMIDTPGIGSTYPHHTAITKQYIKQADAAMFVMNPTPLEDIEVDFLKEIVSVTPGILFVTTKIDQNGNDSVEESLKRNRQIIETAVGSELPFGISMLKMSSKLLLEAAAEKDEMTSAFNYEISGYDDVKSAMNNMVFTILGYYRSGLAYNACVEYYKDVLNTLKLRHETAVKAATEYDNLLKSYESAQANFNENMGEAKKKELVSKIEAVLKTMEYDFNQIFAPKGNIITKYTDEIEKLSEAEMTTYSEDLGDKIVAEVQNEWDKLTSLVMSRIEELITQFDKDCYLSIPEGIITISKDNIDDPLVKDVQMRDRIGKMRNEMFLGTAITGALSTVVGGAYFFLPALVTPALPVIAPVMVVLGIGSVLWGAISGNQKAKQETLQKNKSNLLKHLSETMAYCRKQIVDVSLADGKYQSLYQGFVNATREQVKNTMSNICSKYSNQLESMKKTVVESKQNPQLVMALEHLVTEWSKNKVLIKDVHDKLENVKPE